MTRKSQRAYSRSRKRSNKRSSTTTTTTIKNNGDYDALVSRIEARMNQNLKNVSEELDIARTSLSSKHQLLSEISDSREGGIACRRIFAGVLDVGFLVFLLSLALASVWIYLGINANW